MKNILQILLKLTLCCQLLILAPVTIQAATGNNSMTGNNPIWMSFNESSAKEYSTANILSTAGLQNMLESGELQIISTDETQTGTTTRLMQYYQGIPVLGSAVVIRITNNNQPRCIYATIAKWTDNTSLTEEVTSDEAREIAVDQIKPTDLRSDIIIRKFVLPVEGSPLACWQVLIPADEPLGDWEVIVNAENGSIMQVDDQLRYLNGSGLVFDPDPITATGDTTLRDNQDDADAIPNEAYSEIDLYDISQDEDDLYILSGPHVDTEPTEDRIRLDEAEFIFNREDDQFEEVMAYFHIDRQARYIISLGFDDLPPSPQHINTNGIDEDFSFFSPQTEIITTGSGGVDDAEDADVLIHEYGHALIERIIADWRGGDSRMLSEGLCDYLAGDWSLYTAPDFQPYLVFNWDGHNNFWEGRVLDSDYRYPEVNDLEQHDAGQLWSSLLTEIRLASDERDLWNTVVIDHIYSLGDSVTVPIAAEALLESDQSVAEGQFRQLIVNACESREIFTSGQYSPYITHQPVRDTEDINSPRRVAAIIQSEHPLDDDELLLIYRFNDDDYETVNFETTDAENEYEAFIPAPRQEVDVFYYLSASDTSGVFSTYPAEAPLELLTFHIGPDRIPPIIVEVDSLYNSPFLEGEMAIGTRVIDNLGVAEVSLVWYWGRLEPGGIITLERSQADTNLFTGRLHWSVEEQNFIRYMITALDASETGNTISSNLKTFEITSNVIVDDFERPTRRWSLDGWQRSDQTQANGLWSLHDRPENVELDLPREATAEIDEDWNLAIFDRARLRFWEKHEFDSDAGERCVLEIREIDSNRWREATRFTGSQNSWELRTIELPDYCLGRAEPVRVRFRTNTPRNSENLDGMRIDDFQLLTGNLVDVNSEQEINPVSMELSEPYPNPFNATTRLSYTLPEACEISLSLFDINGRLMENLESGFVEAGSHLIVVNAGDLPSGLYLVKLNSKGEILTQQIVLVK
jgi:hypothetical protein